MTETNHSIGHFEQLPNEILLDLFESYMRLYDLYNGFYLLNHCRINQLLQSASLSINMPSRDIFHLKSFTHFSNQIISLKLSTFCNDLDLLKFPNLRSVHIEKPTRSQILSIRAEYLPNLIDISLSPCWFSFDELPRYLTNLSVLCPFKGLRRCTLPHRKLTQFSVK